jgi:hypothetical protein
MASLWARLLAAWRGRRWGPWWGRCRQTIMIITRFRIVTHHHHYTIVTGVVLITIIIFSAAVLVVVVF